MKKRLFMYAVLIIFTGLVGFFSASVYVSNKENIRIVKAAIMEITRIAADLYSDDIDIAAFVQAGSDTRITVISPDGTVLADNQPIDLGAATNYLLRPEVQAAANGSPAAFVRYSDTLGTDLIYYALKVNTNDGHVFIRAAMPVSGINAYLYQSLPLFIMFLLAVAVLCFVLVRILFTKIARPFNSVAQKLRLLSGGEYISEPIAGSYEEIDEITREIDEIALVLQDGFDSLNDEKTKMDYILNNIGDGIFAVDENKNVVLINNSALGIFDVTPDIINKNTNYLTNDKILAGNIEDCIKSSNNALFELALNGKTYLVTVKLLPRMHGRAIKEGERPGTKLIMTVLSDVTENRENAKRREEFFTNASHELKTPLTAIKGFNELTAINNKDENIKKYIDSITRETDRMLLLIGDMLKLSELESAPINDFAFSTGGAAPVSLAGIIKEAGNTMSTAIAEKSIIFKVSGDGMIAAKQEHIYELVKNLIENAVRYNNHGGAVSVDIKSRNKTVRADNPPEDEPLVYAARFAVSDNGIGISPEEQTRIFERFYRVEKSRSQRGGGTGLGLSIVKHICALYGWKISLKSKLGVGTDITVTFEK